jgi:hypothetical protein
MMLLHVLVIMFALFPLVWVMIRSIYYVDLVYFVPALLSISTSCLRHESASRQIWLPSSWPVQKFPQRRYPFP